MPARRRDITTVRQDCGEVRCRPVILVLTTAHHQRRLLDRLYRLDRRVGERLEDPEQCDRIAARSLQERLGQSAEAAKVDAGSDEG